MRYYEEKGNKYVENGKSLVRVGLVTLKPSPLQEGRTLKVFEVVEVIKTHPTNPIIPGHHLALSFPNEKLNTKEFSWFNHGWEECQVPLQVSDQALARSMAGVTKEVKRN